MSSLTETVNRYIKNLRGWSTSRQLIVFSVDDYGTIRMASDDARQNLKNKGLSVDLNRFNQYDCLENADDLNQLFDILNSVRDINGSSAVFTAYALPANIDFDRMKNENFESFYYKRLPETLAQLPGYDGTWKAWQEGISTGMLSPEFHGREHVNVPLLMKLLKERNDHVLSCFNELSWGGLEKSHAYNLSYTASFDFDDFSQNSFFEEVILDGLNVFENVFGKRALCFNSPGAPAHRILEKQLAKGGIQYLDSTFITREHQGNGEFKKRINYFGKRNELDQLYLMRNSMFEPGLDKSNCVNKCLADINAAFALKKPVNISSHRVNFCGGINSSVREFGLHQLQVLLKEIIKRWPKVEFISASQLGSIMDDREIKI